ncbi:hydroxylysine kinase isoform X2 [Dermacentor andersoni]|uniref:hydroxylysine kinase isoform X2 n=1 Tax=Dermacentor andersoni TaxID=34620 RepID=UPI002416D33F|nr:hydroxylysine kinase-like isoform X2 [Dermacentor andersoni]
MVAAHEIGCAASAAPPCRKGSAHQINRLSASFGCRAGSRSPLSGRVRRGTREGRPLGRASVANSEETRRRVSPSQPIVCRSAAPSSQPRDMFVEQPIKPWLDVQRAALLTREEFGFTAHTVTELISYDDRNFKVQLAREDPDWERHPHGFVLKVTNWIESQQTEFLGTFVKECAVRLFTFLPGRTLNRRKVNDRLCLTWGDLLGRIHRTIQEPERYPTLLSRYTPWSLWSVTELVGLVDNTVDTHQDRTLVHSVLAAFTQLQPQLRSLPTAVLHGDLNENNVLTRPKGDDSGSERDEEVYGVLDWGDVHGGPRVLDLAVLLAYVFLAPGDRSPEENAGLALSGYLRHVPGEAATMPLLKTLVAARLCQSLVKGLESFRKNPDNQYVLSTQESGWWCLRRLWNTPNELLLRTWKGVIAEADEGRGATST